ncbi:MAG: PDZ domain-containing protein [Ignavibacteriales bacterium]|nr:PDZ domain-containing protein [Ignavibacteriales bacterium]
MVRSLVLTFLLCLVSPVLMAQVDARMLQYPDVSQTQIVFSYAGDLWVVPKDGGTALKLSSPRGQELFPHFSPDGSQIAYSANYDGNLEVYSIPAMGGLPTRVTYHGMNDRLVDWYPDGGKLLFVSSMNSGRQRYNQFFSVSPAGGMPEQLPVPYGEMASLSPDGKSIAYTSLTQAFRTWKRYRGGWSSDIIVFDLEKKTSEVVAADPANDEFPMWHGRTIYFLSDRGPEARSNIWSYNLQTKQTKQITKFTEYDIHFPSLGPSDIVFEMGGKLYVLNLAAETTREVPIKVVTDEITLLPRTQNVSKAIQRASIAPDGKRALFEARGEVFSVPAEYGPVLNLTRTPGSAERSAAWSPDGKFAAYWSDKSGEYELMLLDLTTPGSEKKLTSYGPGFRYSLSWSPNSKMVAFIDNAMKIQVFDIEKNKTIQVDKQMYYYQGALNGFEVSWSPDSRWLAYGRELENRSHAIFLFDTKEEKAAQVTSGYYQDSNPSFDPDGKYLFFLTGRTLNPMYSDVDNTWIYPNTTNLAVATLSDETPSPLAPRNDSTLVKKEEPKKEEPKEKDKEKVKKDEKSKETKVTLAGFERRVVVLPPAAGNFGSIHAISGKILFVRTPNTGSADKKRSLLYYDLDKREEKTVLDDVDMFDVSADGKKILVGKSGSYSIVDVGENQKLDKKMPTSQLEMVVDPRGEWKQIFTDVWRFDRDFFYDPTMHGVDWSDMRARYGRMLDNAVTRWDVNFVIGELMSELNSSHTYRGGGDIDDGDVRSFGYLGVDWELANGAYRIKNIIAGAPWDTEVRSPLAQPAVNVHAGDYVLAVNGLPIDVTKAPWAAFSGLDNKAIELTVNSKPTLDGARRVLVQTIADETRLRHLAWIEMNRKRVQDATNGRIGYIYVPSTGTDGQTELVRQFAAQFNKEGLIVDERFNSGGQIPDRFIELLNRKPLAFWAVRDGKNWQWPVYANFGPKVMLINGWSGSGGDAFPDYFRKAGLGPLIGMRTWGGLIGITGAPALVDGGNVSVPTFRMYNPDGTWFKEGHGVDPDIEVKDDPAELAKGIDPQLERGIEEVMKLLNAKPFVPPKQPPYEKR